MKSNLILGIETSCDETSICVLENGRKVLSNIISSQIPIHRRFGGVVPEIASRQHVDNIATVFEEAMAQAGVQPRELDAIAVTYGPGLVGALLVGLTFAKGLAFALDKPLIGVNHLEGHFYANYLCHEQLEPPFIALVVSGGHTSLLNVQDYQNFSVLGQTLDDAAGEAFDKVARVLGLPYPGGPEVDALARTGNPLAVRFPHAKVNGKYNFSFSGLKSSVINHIHHSKQKGEEFSAADICACFQEAVVGVLVEKSIAAMQEYGYNKLVMAGGVSANTRLRTALNLGVQSIKGELYYPTPQLCTDNAAMIACRGYHLFQAGFRSGLGLNANPSLKI